ncbi:TIGR03749 family integrating conjugative element protein [Rodentibacter pneumotropicus]|uniref:Integrating conjugative element protein n=1 Tax=Rodentibacter trehalosifermentans TaxID=1908263 RepID=A0A1V3J6V4_9PAST|nr:MULTISPECIES: TIGR03749 family integrating conjugative element protein [Rodentibacter]MDC2825908.1 TIGR03749 family integrating conjugative element protein [Rodentibacter pneumotropicus]OOF50796.1 integrating conjugative element protein [Rodentibacter trehalosifermentans]
MKKSTRLLKTLTVSTALFSAFSIQAEILMKWDRTPLAIDLATNKERIIFVDKNVKVGIPQNLQGKLRVQSVGGAVYFTALEPFELNRIQLREIGTGQNILLDMKAVQSQRKPDHIRLVFDEDVQSNQPGVEQTRVSDSVDNEVSQVRSALPVPAALVRYAAQSLYAPLRTVEPLPGVRRVAMKLPSSLPTLLPNLKVRATPLESWGLDGMVVTAVKIQHLEPFRVNLDPRYLQGNFYAASFQHGWIGEYGSLNDTTTVYLVTEGDVSKAIIPSNLKTKSSTKKLVKKTVTVPAQ